mmetsp:Transcript_39093/g.104895  ORF Transcript_39093/g.104895 Transcript_39093/m.104895 type:complete len:204 (-) Transcript_39093:1311-1922(-)
MENSRKQIFSVAMVSTARMQPESQKSATAPRSVARAGVPSCPQSAISPYLFARSASLSASFRASSCSGRCAFRSCSPDCSTRCITPYAKTTVAPAWKAAASPVAPVAMRAHTPSVAPSLVNSTPTRVCGMTLTRMTGHVPRSIPGMFSWSMPQSTLVGKSGPATRMHTLNSLKPSSLRTASIARTPTLVTPTKCCTFTDLPMT